MSRTGTIAEIKMYAKKGDSGSSVPEAALVEGLGMEGDCHACGGEKQLSLLQAEAREWLAALPAGALCFSTFKENIVLNGFSMEQLGEGTLLKTEETIIKITKQYRQCREGCSLFSPEKPCKGAQFGTIFAQVIQSGLIKKGDVLIYEP